MRIYRTYLFFIVAIGNLSLSGCASVLVSNELDKKCPAVANNACTKMVGPDKNGACTYQVIDANGNPLDANLVASFAAARPVDCATCPSLLTAPTPDTGDFQDSPYCQYTGDATNPTCYLSFDYNCDGKAEQEHVNRLVCNATAQSAGWGPNPQMPKQAVEIPECGVQGYYYTGATFDATKPADMACTVKAPNGNPVLKQRCK